MVIRRCLATAAGLALLASCRAARPAAAIDPALSARVPAATVALAGIDLDRLRASPAYASVPPSALTFLENFRQAHRVLFAFTGVELLTIVRGTMPGATRVAPDIAVSGGNSLVAEATAPHPPAAILVAAESAATRPLWLAVRGGVSLPLSGNLANVNNLLRDTEFVTLAGQPADPLDLELVARCPTADTALRFEQSLRAIVSLAKATSGRQPETLALWESIRMRREERAVRVTLSAPLAALVQLLP